MIHLYGTYLIGEIPAVKTATASNLLLILTQNEIKDVEFLVGIDFRN